MFTRSWEQLPSELRDYIYASLANSGKMKEAFISELSLVSQAWSRQFRPRLFAFLKLENEEDCRILYGILRSPLSSWLGEHITTLTLYSAYFPNRPLSTALVRLLPTCRIVRVGARAYSATSERISRSPALKLSLRGVTSLRLFRCHFPSLRTLLRVLGDITYLEVVDLYQITWSGNLPMTAEAASNVCNGTFSHVHEIRLQGCTNNLAIPAWMLAAASTRHLFTRRRTAELAVPAETWAIIELIQMFLGDDTILLSEFYVKEATSGESISSLCEVTVLTEHLQDTYRFVGSLLNNGPASMSISVQTVKFTPSGGGSEVWSVRQVALADLIYTNKPHLHLRSRNFDTYKSHLHLRSHDWPTIASLLPTLPRLQRFQVLCGEGYSEADFRALSDEILGAVNNHPAVTVQHDPNIPDGRLLQPTLFSLTKKDMVQAREEKVWTGAVITPPH